MANSVDPDQTARYDFEPSLLDLHCLQRYLYWSARMKGLSAPTKCLKVFIMQVLLLGAVAKPPPDLTYHISTISFPVTTNLITA